jgi:DNA-binding SARP family transcriptional activator
MTEEFSFNVLGPWDVRVGRRAVTVPRGQLGTLLASLLLSCGEPVPVGVLETQLWPDRASSRAQGAVHTYVNRLRKLLGHELIETMGGAYRVVLARDCVDLHRFRDLIDPPDHIESVSDELARLREALVLWRGRPFGDAGATWLDRHVVPRLVEEWFTATERRIDLEMAAGQPGRLIGELWELTNQYPTRESLWLRLITALHRSGRRAEALDAYQQLRTALRDELGIDPGEQLAQLHRAVLLDGTKAAQQPVPPAHPPQQGPRQLPHDIATFSGRSEELAALDAMLATGANAARRAPTIVAIDGAPGTGKTTLAVHWAHRVAAGYPDVQLYLNLGGYGPGGPMAPANAAETLLRALGVASDLIPTSVEERAALLRTSLAGRRALIMLDNARDTDQVRALLPGTDSLVIVTSRNQLRSLSIRDGAHRVTLHRLTQHQAVDLLTATVGSERVAAEATAAARLVALCDHLPLALAIVAERAHRTGALAEVVSALENEKARLDNLGTGEDDQHTDLRAALSWSYRALGIDAAAMFRHLGLHPANDIGLQAAAALADRPVAQASDILDQLVAAHLVEQRRPGRYELHDLIRLYATDQAHRHDPSADRDAAVRRVLDWYLHAAVQADRQLLPYRRRDFLAPYQPQTPPPVFADPREATTWFEAEYDCLRSVSVWAATNGWPGHGWRIATAMTTLFDRMMIPWRDGLEFYETVLRGAEVAEEDVGEGYTLNSLGCVCYFTGDLAGAISYLERSLARFRQTQHLRGEAMLLGNLGLIYAEAGDHDAALPHALEALRLCERLDYPRGTALNLDNLGIVHSAAGDHDKAVECHEKAHAINHKLGDAPVEAMNQHHLGRAYAGVGRVRSAIRAFRTAITLYGQSGNRRWAAIALADLGELLAGAGHARLARGISQAALQTMTEFGDPRAERLRAGLAAQRD